MGDSYKMAESSEPHKIKLTVKTPKDKKDVEVPEEASVKEVRNEPHFLELIIMNYFAFCFEVWFS